MHKFRGSILVPLFVLFSQAVVAADAVEDAREIDRMLQARQLGPALASWEAAQTDILADMEASLIAAKAFITWGGSDLAMQYQELPEQAVAEAVKCLDAASKLIGDEDSKNIHRLSGLRLDAAEIYLARGHGDKAGTLQDAAFEDLKKLAEQASPLPGALMDLGRFYGRLATREPPKAEEHIAKAAELYKKVEELQGKSADLSLCIGRTQTQLAEMLQERQILEPKDRKLAKAVKEAREAAIEAFEDGLEQDEKHVQLRTAYNECLWELQAVMEGKCRKNPIMKDYESRYHKLEIKIPDSTLWQVKQPSEIEDKDEVFSAIKINRKAGEAVMIWIEQYKWDTNYVDEESGSKVGGDNIGGLAKRSEQWLRQYFKDIKDREPLRKRPLNRKIRKSEAYVVKGITQKGYLAEWRVYFFKHSKAQRTYRVTILADLGMLDRNPYELDEVLNTLELKSR